MKNIIITSGAGFIGSALVRRFIGSTSDSIVDWTICNRWSLRRSITVLLLLVPPVTLAESKSYYRSMASRRYCLLPKLMQMLKEKSKFL